MPKRPVKKLIKKYSYRRKNGKLIKVPTHPRTYYIGKMKQLKDDKEITEIIDEISEITKEINKWEDARRSSKKLYSTKYFEETVKPDIDRPLTKLHKKKQELLIKLINKRKSKNKS